MNAQSLVDGSESVVAVGRSAIDTVAEYCREFLFRTGALILISEVRIWIYKRKGLLKMIFQRNAILKVNTRKKE